MSFSGKHTNKINVDYKARLEYKLYLARENPEPVFDVSECALKHVPSGIYSLCKVFRKKTLLMYNNKLSSLSGGGALSDLSLLTILDIHGNEFTSLPSDIMCLSSLKELYLQDNNICKLPNEIVRLNKLTSLNISRNNLKQLPEEIGQLQQLTALDISHNKLLQKLPKSLGYVQQLVNLNIDGLNLSYPPQDIIVGGTIVIIAFMANEIGIEYSPEDSVSETTDISSDISSDYMQAVYHNKSNDMQATLQKLDKMKEHRQHALLEVEKNIKQQQECEMEVHSMLKIHRKKLLEDLALQQIQLEQELGKVQQEKDTNRTRLLSYIYNAEREADNVIKEFLKNSEEERQSQAELLEQEKREEMNLLSICHSEQFMLRTKDILFAMEKLLEEEMHKARKLEEHIDHKNYTAQSLLAFEIRYNDYLAQILQEQDKNKQDLIDTLRKDQHLQCAIVATLLERSDARSWSIIQQVHLVQSQLAALTNIELERRKLEMNQQLNEIADKRIALTGILVDLLEQKKNRGKQLLDTIETMGRQHISNTRHGSVFWLMQYQTLMEARPQGMLEMLEPMLVRHVAIAGALHCLPFLTNLPSLLPDLSEEQLKDIGICCEKDRSAIMLAVENYLAEVKLNESTTPLVTPSAPLEEASTSSQDCNFVHSINTTECVICLDLKCEVVFVPCGHLCCCFTCADKISTECPMCRSSIDHKIRIV